MPKFGRLPTPDPPELVHPPQPLPARHRHAHARLLVRTVRDVCVHLVVVVVIVVVVSIVIVVVDVVCHIDNSIYSRHNEAKEAKR